MDNPDQFMGKLLASWFERDPVVRRENFRATFHPDVQFFDRDHVFVGYEQLEGFSDSLQRRFESERFVTTSAVERLGNALRVFWKLGSVPGMDLAILDGDQIRVLYAFVGQPPPPR